MTTKDLSHLAPTRPSFHVAPAAGWMNDPNGLCFRDGLWHAYYQHDPHSDTHGPMHWGHATSRDLLRWEHHPIALHPDQHGVIFSGSVVIDVDDTAGFGQGAMIAVFTHDLEGRQQQSLAFSHDGGYVWEKYAHNPVLESDEKDFRDPKVIRTATGWLMALAVGDRIEFYSSTDLRSWESTGCYSHELDASGIWECPDLIRLSSDANRVALTFCVTDAGPNGHSGTLLVEGRLAGGGFEASGVPRLLDNGPDFYAAQSFHASPGTGAVFMGWMSSWNYSHTHPSRGRRGVLSLPRLLTTSPSGLRVAPAIDLERRSERVDATRWESEPDRGAVVVAGPGTEINLVNGHGVAATVELDDGSCSITRHGGIGDGSAQRYEAALTSAGPHLVAIDHGTLEVFAAGGEASLSALIFAGEEWAVEVDGPATLRVL